MPDCKQTEPGDRFNRYFTATPALNDGVRDAVYQIRHDVYAREFGFEPVRDDQRETDRYDRHSVHCLVRTADVANLPVGCVRVVQTDPDARFAPLPFEIACQDTLDRSVIDPAKLPRERIGEVSRLAVMSDFRRRKGETAAVVSLGDNDFGGKEVPRFPNIPLALYFASVLMAQRQGIEYLFVLTEPRLSKHFIKLGVNLTAVGAPINHRGIRIPSVMRVPDVYPGLRRLVRPIWHAIEQQLDEAYASQPPLTLPTFDPVSEYELETC